MVICMSMAETLAARARQMWSAGATGIGRVLALAFGFGNRKRGPIQPEIPGLPPGLKRDMPLIPVDSAASRALVAVVAILAFLAAMAAGAAHMVARASADWRGAIASEMTIQIRPDVRRDMERDLAAAATAARATAGVAEARVVARAESDAMLEPWLGRGLQLSELPVPRLVVLTVPPGSRPDVEALRRDLARVAPTALLDDHRLWVGRLSTMANTMILAGIVVVILITVAAALAVAFATRGAMAGSRDSVEVLHMVGADDAFIAREFQTRFFRLGLKGGAIGGLAALVVTALTGWLSFSLASGPGADQLRALFGSFEVGWRGYLIVLIVAMAVAAIAGVMSRFTVRRHLRDMA
jgi:cell division transport system permease protein